MSKLFAITLDNRGTADQPFGFVYLSTSSKEDTGAGRIGYGANRENPHPLALWPCRETPDSLDSIAIERVRTLLHETFPNLSPAPPVPS